MLGKCQDPEHALLITDLTQWKKSKRDDFFAFFPPNVKFSTKDHKSYKETGKRGPLKGKNKFPEIVSVETQASNFLDKAIDVLKEQKENTNKELKDTRKQYMNKMWISIQR